MLVISTVQSDHFTIVTMEGARMGSGVQNIAGALGVIRKEWLRFENTQAVLSMTVASLKVRSVYHQSHAVHIDYTRWPFLR